VVRTCSLRREILILGAILLGTAMVIAGCGPLAPATPTPIPSPTKTPRPTFTPQPTRTPTPRVTNTPTSTSTPLATVTFTPRPPTNTPVLPPPPPPPTNTPVPPATPTPAFPFTAGVNSTAESNCGVTDVRGTVYDRSGNRKNGVVVWLSDESGNYKGFSFGPTGGTGEDPAMGQGGYRITIGPGARKGRWFVVAVRSKTDLTELSNRFYFETDSTPCAPGSGGRQQWVVDFKEN
jgi:hypothetical protein